MIIVKIVKEYVWGACFVFFVLQNTVSDCPKHYVLLPQTVCLTLSNMLFDNFNTYVFCTHGACFEITDWLSERCRHMQILGIFCPNDFQNGFRGHSRDSKRAIIDYMFFAKIAPWFCQFKENAYLCTLILGADALLLTWNDTASACSNEGFMVLGRLSLIYNLSTNNIFEQQWRKH